MQTITKTIGSRHNNQFQNSNPKSPIQNPKSPMPLFWLSLAFFLGILSGAYLPLAKIIWFGLARIILLFVFVSWLIKRYHNRRIIRSLYVSSPAPPAPVLPTFPPLSILFFALTMGAARYLTNLPDLTDPEFIFAHNDSGQKVVLTGVLTDLPDERDRYTNLRIESERLRPEGGGSYTDLYGLLLARVPPGDDFHYGDRLILRGTLQTPPENEDFSYREYLARKDIYSFMPYADAVLLEPDQGKWTLSLIYSLKERALELVYRFWPDPEASLLSGILLGIETGIPEPVEKAFRDTGTSHVIAISGFNITIVAGIFASTFGRLFNPRRGFVFAILAIAVYTILVGADAPVVRAAIMGGFTLFARQIGRRQNGLNILGFTAALMCLTDPKLPWDVGFQLSFAATLGLVLYAEPMSTAFVRLASRFVPEENALRLAGPVGEFFLATIGAQITILPIIIFHFQRLSLSSLITNPLILPAQPAIMILGGLSVMLGVIWVPLGNLVAFLAWPFALFTIRAVEMFATIKGGVLVLGEVSPVVVLLLYVVIFGLTFAGSELRKLIRTWGPVVMITILGISTIFVWRSAASAPDGNLHLTLFDVGTGDALLIETPTGRYVLINGGSSTTLLSNGLGKWLPTSQRRLDYLVVASPREEQIAALPRVVERYPPSSVLWAGLPSPEREADYLRETLIENQIPITTAEAGHSLDLGAGAILRVLTVGNLGAILSLEWGNFRALLPLGANFEALESLSMGEDIGQVTALLLADNGYAPSNPSEWIDNLHPQVTLLSVAADDRDGLPDRETLEALEGYSLLRTDRKGWIHISTDGEGMWVEVERE